jgi:hypothetical protein
VVASTKKSRNKIKKYLLLYNNLLLVTSELVNKQSGPSLYGSLRRIMAVQPKEYGEYYQLPSLLFL